MTRGADGTGWMSVEDMVRVEEHSLSDYLKRAEVNLDRVLDAFVKTSKETESKCEQKKMKLDRWLNKTTTWVVSVKN